MRVVFSRREDEGVASSIGTMLAILVLLALLSMVTTSWAPEWTAEKESEHMRQVEAQFAELKALLDQLSLSGNTATVVSSPITLGSKGTPLFSGDSIGTISLLSSQSDGYNTFSVTNSTGKYLRVAYGSIMYESENTEYLDQIFMYECGAIIIVQDDGSLVTTGPGIIVYNASGALRVSLSMLSVYSDGTTYTGQGTVGVQCRLVNEKIVTTRTWMSETLYINVTSSAYEAWYNYLRHNIPKQGVGAGDFDISVDEDASTVHLTLRNVSQLTTDYAILGVSLDLS